MMNFLVTNEIPQMIFAFLFWIAIQFMITEGIDWENKYPGDK